MTQREDWLRLQTQLQSFGFLESTAVREIGSDADIGPELRGAIAHAGGIANIAGTPFGFNDIGNLSPIGNALDGRFCGVPDRGGTIGTMAFGSPRGRWSKGALRISINTAGCAYIPTPVVNVPPQNVIVDAFNRWQSVSGGYFTFTFVPVESTADIRVVFAELDAQIMGGVLGRGAYPEHGKIQFDSAQFWSQDGIVPPTSNLRAVAVHEIGHALGLSHSSSPGGTMYPYQAATADIDDESITALRLLYGWAPQSQLGDRATSDRPTLGVTYSSTFLDTLYFPRMVWKGASGDSAVYQSSFIGGSWGPQERIEGIGASHSPALAEISLGGAPPRTGLVMAWKGSPGDQGLYWSRDLGTGWQPQRNVAGVGSSSRPALARAAGQVHMAWKGIGGDSGIYWSTFDGVENWSPQRRIDGVGTSNSPALVGVGNRLFMFWKGVEGDSTAYWSLYDFDTPGGPIWRPQRRIEYFSYTTAGGVPLAIGTTGGLTATQRGDSILLAWKGAEGDSGIYVSTFASGEFGGQVRVANVGTATGPSVVQAGNFTYMAWKGAQDDNTIWWSLL